MFSLEKNYVLELINLSIKLNSMVNQPDIILRVDKYIIKYLNNQLDSGNKIDMEFCSLITSLISEMLSSKNVNSLDSILDDFISKFEDKLLDIPEASEVSNEDNKTTSNINTNNSSVDDIKNSLVEDLGELLLIKQ